MFIPLGNKVRAEVISSVLGQLSDGIWENSNGMNKYWKFADVYGTNLDISDEMYDYGYGGYLSTKNGFYDKTEKDVRDWFANKAKQVVKIWAEDYGKNPNDVWDRNNTDVVDYMGGHVVSEITVADVYECYDFLKGRSGKKYGAKPVEEPIDEPYEVVDDVVEPKTSGGMNPSQQELEDFFLDASTRVERKGYVRASDDCYIDTVSGDKYTYDELEDYWNKNKNSDPVLSQYSSFKTWFDDSRNNGYYTPCDDVEACGYIGASDDILAYGKCIGYGVDYRNMHNAIHGILVFSDRDDAEWAYDELKRASRVDYGHEYDYILDDVFNSSIEVLEEINYRDFTDVAGEKVYPYHDDEFIIIVNDISVDVFV